ncbi:MAG: (Fe-S)-binding protein [Desulfovibrionales bacterium]|nr:(Fe-S)-binding protein [Desulfovibrionales bacterium]
MTHDSTPSTRQQEPACILCGKCVSVCPVFLATKREELSPKAKQRTLAALRGNTQKLTVTDCTKLAEMCLSCGKCATACPQELNFPQQLAAMRASHPDWRQWVWKRWITQGKVLWPMLSTLSSIAPDAKGKNEASRLIKSMQAMQPPTDIPEYFRVSRYDTTVGAKNHVLLFAGCTANRVQKNWKHKSEHILRQLGFTVLPDDGLTCCGLTLDHAGIPDSARKSRKQNLRAWRTANRPLLVTFCATCYLGLKEYAHDDSLDWAEGEKEAWLDAVTPLATLWGTSEFSISVPDSVRLRYHQPCHWHGTDADFVWLSNMLGDDISAPASASCCGMGGIAQLANRPLSQQVASACWAKLLAPSRKEKGAVHGSNETQQAACCDQPSRHAQSPTSSASEKSGEARDVNEPENIRYLVITGCSGCVMQLRGTAPELDGKTVTVGHWLDILAC